VHRLVLIRFERWRGIVWRQLGFGRGLDVPNGIALTLGL
jgi:hypothetical protein